MNQFFFTSVNKHVKQGHFDSWRNDCEAAFGQSSTEFLNFKDFDDMYINILTNATRFAGQHIHIEWIHDLDQKQITKFDLLATRIQFSWSSHMSVSQVLRNNSGSNREVIKDLFKHLQSMAQLTTIWTWDTEFHGKKYGGFRLQKVPDIQNTDLSEMKCKVCTQFQSLGLPTRMIGLVGQLYGYRGVDLVASFARKNRDMNFLMIGRGHAKTYSRRTKLFIRSKTKNVFIFDEYLETDIQLNHAINHLSCLVIDTSRYPEPSGIATRALSFGIPTLIKDNDSFLRFQSNSLEGIHVFQEKFGRRTQIDWKKVSTPISPVVIAKETLYLELLEAKKATLGSRL